MLDELDFLMLDQLLSTDDRLIRDSVRTFIDKKFKPIVAQHYRAGTFPTELITEVAELGLLGSTMKDFGGAGVSELAYGLIMQELERGDSGLRSFCSVQGSLVIYPIFTFGSDKQRSQWLPNLIGGKAVGCFGLTEPDFGSNPSGMRTRSKKVGDHIVLNGSKMWITNASIADVAVVFARDEEDTIRGYLVERGSPGFTTRELKGKLSLRASVTGELIFDDCRIPASAELPGAIGIRAALMCLNQARYGIAFGAVGAAMACFLEALEYAKSRVQFDRPIAGYQLIQAQLVQMYSEIAQAQLLCLRLAQLKQAGKLSHVAISLAKRNNVAMALRHARQARDILGANGIVDEYSAMRHMCNLEAVSTYEGTHNIHTLVVGQALTGLSAFFG